MHVILFGWAFFVERTVNENMNFESEGFKMNDCPGIVRL